MVSGVEINDVESATAKACNEQLPAIWRDGECAGGTGAGREKGFRRECGCVDCENISGCVIGHVELVSVVIDDHLQRLHGGDGLLVEILEARLDGGGTIDEDLSLTLARSMIYRLPLKTR